MNTNSNHHDHDHDDIEADERAEAVRQADAGAQAWRAAVHAQGGATAEHGDFYAIAGELAYTLAAVAALAEVLAWQVAHYADAHPVYDDSRVVDPRERLDLAALDLHELAARAREAERSANTFWSRISHIGVDHGTDQSGEVATGAVAEVSR